MSQHKKDPDPGSAAPTRPTITGDASSRPAGSGIFNLPEMAFQELYIWLIFVSSLDIMLTWVILRNGGEEVNPVAELVIEKRCSPNRPLADPWSKILYQSRLRHEPHALVQIKDIARAAAIPAGAGTAAAP